MIRHWLFFLLVTVFFTCCQSKEEENTKRPNILILFSDQHNKQVMGFEGHPDVITPNLDKFASEAFVFDRAYCTTGICAPARSSLMTGIYPRTLGILSNSEKTSVMKEVVSLPAMLKRYGYKTYAFGKRHTRLAIDEGWDVHKSHLCDESPGDNYVTWVEAEGYGAEFSKDWAAEFGRGSKCSQYSNKEIATADLGTRISALPETHTMEAFTAQHTIEMIRTHSQTEEPFFCWATFYRPHQPYTPLKKYMDKYDVSGWGEGTKNGDKIKMPASFYEPTENLPPLLQSQRNGGNKVWNMDKAFSNEQLWRNYIGGYYALVTEMDYQIGRILEELEAAGLKDETIIIYTSDHGDFVGNHGMVEKAAMGQNVYEDILNIPLIIRYPGQNKAGVLDVLVSQVDLYPTILEYLGVNTPDLKYPLQGISLHNLLRGKPYQERQFIVSESWSQATVITEKDKLGIMLDPTEYMRRFDYRDFGDMYFIRTEDKLELHNGISLPQNKQRVDQLRDYYEAFGQEFQDIGKQEVIASFSEKDN